MKNLIKSFKENKNKIKDKLITLSTGIGVTLILCANKVYAASGTESIDSFINFACDWLTKIRWNSCSCWWSYVCITVGREKMLRAKVVDL